jgi:hypothetical protein
MNSKQEADILKDLLEKYEQAEPGSKEEADAWKEYKETLDKLKKEHQNG